MELPGNVDRREIGRFDQLSALWWDPRGELGSLHTINPLRLKFISENSQLQGLDVLDIGCGGGLLTEALAKAGARVTGIDLSEASISVAVRHAQRQGLNIDYRCEEVAEFAGSHAASFSIVTCMEMLEHVPDPEQIITSCSEALKPGGRAYFSTINRTLKAFFFAILAGEYLIHLLPKGSHKYGRLIRPGELKKWAERAGLEYIRSASLMYNPLTRRFSLAARREDINYMVEFIKRN